MRPLPGKDARKKKPIDLAEALAKAVFESGSTMPVILEDGEVANFKNALHSGMKPLEALNAVKEKDENGNK